MCLRIFIVIVSEENLNQFKNRNNIITLENLDEAQLAAVYLRASCLIQMGKSESFGLTIIEALHFGVPCIVNQNTTASTKLIKNGINGYHLKKKEEIIETVLSIIKKRQSLEPPELLNNSVKKYDWSICAKQLFG